MTATEKRPVLVATEADDITADMVITELNRLDVPVVRFNPADIGTDLTVSARFGTCPASVAGHVRTPSRTANLAHVRAVYWRKDYSALSYSVVDLPAAVEEALLAYLDHYGLRSGSFDLAEDQKGDRWWLELNPNGQWGWLEPRTGLHMSAAFAALLAGETS